MFDGNYRPRLWQDAAEALYWREEGRRWASLGLPTLEDETMLCGARDADAVAQAWADGSEGGIEVVVKLGAEGCRLPGGSVVRPPAVLRPLDTSGAGDAFDAGYLAARLAGAEREEAALAGHTMAGWVIMRAGAIPDPDGQAPYAELSRYAG